MACANLFKSNHPLFNNSNDKKVYSNYVSYRALSIIDFNKFLQWLKLIQTAAYVFRFIQKIINKIPTDVLTYLLINELQYVQVYIWKITQNQYALSEDNIRNLNLIKDKNNIYVVLVVYRMLRLKEKAKVLFFCPTKARITNLWIYEIHLFLFYASINVTLNEKYW